MDIEKLIEQLKYYGTTYAIGDNLGKEIDGSDELMLNAATALSTLQAENEKLRAELESLKKGHCAGCSVQVVETEALRDLNDAPKLRAELERMKDIMRDNGIMVIPSKYPGGRSEWNIPKPRGQKED